MQEMYICVKEQESKTNVTDMRKQRNGYKKIAIFIRN